MAAAAKAKAQDSIIQMAEDLKIARPGRGPGFDAATLDPIVSVAARVREAPAAARALCHDVLARAVASTTRLNNVRGARRFHSPAGVWRFVV